MAETAGFEPTEITFMNNCYFEDIPADLSPEEALDGRRGIVAMTASELCLLDGALRKAPKRYFLKIPLSEIEGVNRSFSQIQIRHEDRLLVLFLYNWNDLGVNEKDTAELYESLIFQDVPRFETDKEYQCSMLGWPNVKPSDHVSDSYEKANKVNDWVK